MISIAMATYNGELFIREQLDSILTQTFCDWELIVCDDGSSDQTLSILQEYANSDSRIKIYQNEVNLGFKQNFEKAIGLCIGEYIALCDQDDIWYPNHLEILYNQIGNYSLSIGNSDIVDVNNKYLNKRMSDTDGIYFIPKDTRKLLFREFFNSNPFQGASMLLKADFAKKCLPIPTEINYHDTWISTCACLADGLIYTYDSITRYRQHNKNVTIDSHRGCKITKWELYKKYIAKSVDLLLHKYRLETDRFVMVSVLKDRFSNTANQDFKEICLFLDHAKNHQLTIKNIYFLWTNWQYITTSYSKQKFIRSWFIWSHM